MKRCFHSGNPEALSWLTGELSDLSIQLELLTDSVCSITSLEVIVLKVNEKANLRLLV